MSGLDDQLRDALRRREPPQGFSARVLDRVETGRRPSRSRSLWAVAAALALVVGVASYRGHERRIEGERAKEQVMLALRLSGSKLHAVQERVIELQQRTIEIAVQ